MASLNFKRIYAAVLFVSSVVLVRSQQDPNVCSEVGYSCGPLPPKVPTNFILKAEMIDQIDFSLVSWQEVYFDSTGLRARETLVTPGLESVFVYDYDESVYFNYEQRKPGAPPKRNVPDLTKCNIRFIPEGEINVRGFHDARNQMHDASYVLKLGGNYRYQFFNRSKDRESFRNIPADQFYGCVYDEGQTYNTTYSFKRGIAEEDGSIDFTDLGIPITLLQKIQNNQNSSLIANFALFLKEPNFAEDTFKIPKDMFCDGDRPLKKVWPTVPEAFSFRRETLHVSRDMNGDEAQPLESSFIEVWYNKDLNLARVDFSSPGDVFNAGENRSLSPGFYSLVMDFETSGALMSNQVTGQCDPSYIPRSVFLVTPDSANNTNLFPHLMEPMDLFGLTKNHVYKGQYSIRGESADTWMAKTLTNSDGDVIQWHEVSFRSKASNYDVKNEYGLPIQETFSSLVAGDDNTGLKKEVRNYFKIRPHAPSLTVFQNPVCFETNRKRFFQLYFLNKDADAIKKVKEAFLHAVRRQIRIIGEFESILRISQPELYQENKIPGRIVVPFILMDIMPSLTIVQDIDEAISFITEVVNIKMFVVSVTIRNTDGSTKLLNFTADSISETTGREDGTQNSYSNFKADVFRAPENRPDPDGYSEIIGREDGTQNSYSNFKANVFRAPENRPDPDGYSPGSFAGMAVGMLLLGILIGAAVMVVYIKRTLQ